jgi:hypothetical protein
MLIAGSCTHGKTEPNISHDTKSEKSGSFWRRKGDGGSNLKISSMGTRIDFDQAVIDGGTFVYNTYPLEADEEDEDFEMENTTASTDKRLKSDH